MTIQNNAKIQMKDFLGYKRKDITIEFTKIGNHLKIKVMKMSLTSQIEELYSEQLISTKEYQKLISNI